jgi:molecular chaperone GrpE
MEKEQNSQNDENINNNGETAELSKIEKKDNNELLKEEKIEITPEEKIKELEDKLTRSFAEMENQRRRFEKEKDDAFEYGGFSFARETLNLIDNFDRAKQSLENDEAIKNTDTLKKTLDHLDIVKKDLISIFKKNNIEEILAIDKKLDPNLHQAMMEIEDNNKEPGTIVQEIQKGFKMKDRLLRPSLVAVAKKTEENDEKSNENNKK